MKLSQICGFSLLSLLILSFSPDWGFFGHRKINRMAVFTLPEDMLPLYKKNIEYIEEHAVDADKRRYATKFEAIRHYIDIDAWGTYPYADLPRDFNEALLVHSDFLLINELRKDTVKMTVANAEDKMIWLIGADTIMMPSKKQCLYFFGHYIKPQYYEDEWQIRVDSFDQFFQKSSPYLSLKYDKIIVVDHLSEHGILPYYLEEATKKLTRAFERQDANDILRNSADIGHYIGDAHVPLHTTRNYNGQFTDQVGIHAFWESRLPELYSEKSYDFLVGQADYVDDLRSYFWNIVLESNSNLDSVLSIEKRLSQTFPSDQQYCFDERLGLTVKIQCEAYSNAYHEAMSGMVEDRMTKAIHAIGSIWYTAWVNAGQPDLSKLNAGEVKQEEFKVNPNVKTREHEN